MIARYINPYTDFGFKKLFGEEANKDLLMDFLNAVLPSDHQVQTLAFQNPDHLPDSPFQRFAVFDIACISQSGEQFVVEMQKAAQHYYKDRSVYYSTFPIQRQAPKGEWNYCMKRFYFIAILNFEYNEQEDFKKFLREVDLKDQDGDPFFDKVQFMFFQMPLFNKTESELHTRKDKWFYFLKNLENFESIPGILKEPLFEQAFNTAEYVKLPPKEQEIYEHDLKIYRDNYSVLQTAENKGIAEGIEIGRAEGLAEGEAKGKAEGQTEIARNLKRLGVDPATIAQATGLSITEIEKL
ncbi:MAG: Rpn family recombination-promoting nuclease/putative transposase [Planctomycetaceae bacterium]|jgi:predicted transposase/invertase (TIGR01784 family)|nr:Rpn family recombination-promoting nuclease/putative transposase [Planctomycetaceae bacterium]